MFVVSAVVSSVSSAVVVVSAARRVALIPGCVRCVVMSPMMSGAIVEASSVRVVVGGRSK